MARADTKLLVHFDESDGVWTDSSTTGHTLTVSNPGVQAFGKFGPYCTNINGNFTASVSAAYHSDFEIGSLTNWTLDFWMTVQTFAANYVFSIWNDASNYIQIFFDRDTSGGDDDARFVFVQGGVTRFNCTVNNFGDIAIGTWYHVAAAKISSYAALYFDGSLIARDSYSGTFSLGAGSLRMGAGSDSGLPHQGRLDEFRLIHGNPHGLDPTNGSDTYTVPTRPSYLYEPVLTNTPKARTINGTHLDVISSINGVTQS